MSKKKCILVCVSSLTGGGAERVAIELANSCDVEGLEVVLLVGSSDGRYQEIIGAHVCLLTVGVPLAVSKTLHFSFRLRALLKDWEPVVVISHLTEMNRMMLRCRLLGVLSAPVIVVDHNNMALKVGSGMRGRVLRKELQFLYRRASAVVGVSQGVLDSVRDVTGISVAQGEVINNSIDVSVIEKAAVDQPVDEFVEPFLQLPRPVIISVGRLNWQKAYDSLIAAFSELPNDLHGSLVIMGEGELLEDLRACAEKLGVGDQVHFPGFVKNPWWYMAQSDLFVSSSIWEGFGLVLVEAMACGLPVVSTDSPGPAEIIESGISGVLVPVGDASQLNAEVLQCLTDEDLRTQLIAGGLQRVQCFLPKATHAQYMHLISDTLKGSHNV